MNTNAPHLLPSACRRTGLLAALLLAALPASATVLVQTDFDTGYNLGTINGQSSASDIGTTGAWTVGQTTADPIQDKGNFDIVNGGLTYSVAGGGTINGGTQALQYTYNGAANANDGAYISLGSGITSTVYVSFLINVATPAPLSNTYLFLWLSNASGSNHIGNHPGVGIYNSELAAQASNNNIPAESAQTPGTSVTAGTTYLVVAEFSKQDDATKYNSVSLWIDPSYGDAGAPDSSVTGTALSVTNINTIGFQFANMSDTGGVQPNYLIDAITIGTTWDDVVPVSAIPEPAATAALLGVAALFLSWKRRRH